MELAVLSFRLKDKRILLGNADEIFGLIQMLAILCFASEMATARAARVWSPHLPSINFLALNAQFYSFVLRRISPQMRRHAAELTDE
jgi:hypothetical protein